MLTLITGFFVIGAFLLVDWRCLLENRKLRLNFTFIR
jgi:hypothetical protein